MRLGTLPKTDHRPLPPVPLRISADRVRPMGGTPLTVCLNPVVSSADLPARLLSQQTGKPVQLTIQ